MEKKNKKRVIALTLLMVIIVIFVGIGISYAFYTYMGNYTNKDDVSAAKFEIDTTLNNTDTLSNSNMRIIEENEVEKKADYIDFTISNKKVSTVNGSFQIFITQLNISKNLYSKDFKWELLADNDSIANGTFASAIRSSEEAEGEAFNVKTTAEDLILNENGIELEPNKSKNMKLRIWLQDDSENNQKDLMNGSFSAKISVRAVPIK